jgi:hypothetical protein
MRPLPSFAREARADDASRVVGSNQSIAARREGRKRRKGAARRADERRLLVVRTVSAAEQREFLRNRCLDGSVTMEVASVPSLARAGGLA